MRTYNPHHRVQRDHAAVSGAYDASSKSDSAAPVNRSVQGWAERDQQQENAKSQFRNHGPCVAQENGVGKFLVAALAFGKPGQPRSKRAVGAYYGCAAVLPVASGRLRETTRHRARKARLALTGRLSAACLPLLLAACATPTVTRSCLTQQQYEQLKASEPPKVHDKLTGDADKDTRPLAGSALELRSWGLAMLDTLKICSEAP